MLHVGVADLWAESCRGVVRSWELRIIVWCSASHLYLDSFPTRRSSDLHFASIPRRVSAIDAQAGRTQGDAMKYRIYAKWTLETRELMTQLAAKAASMLAGEEQRALAFFRLLQDDVLILTEEFIGPDLREL